MVPLDCLEDGEFHGEGRMEGGAEDEHRRRQG